MNIKIDLSKKTNQIIMQAEESFIDWDVIAELELILDKHDVHSNSDFKTSIIDEVFTDTISYTLYDVTEEIQEDLQYFAFRI